MRILVPVSSSMRHNITRNEFAFSLSLHIFAEPDVCVHHQNIQNYFANGDARFERFATIFDQHKYHLSDAVGFHRFVHRLLRGECICRDIDGYIAHWQMESIVGKYFVLMASMEHALL